jgi:hypothetical protein
MKKSALHLFALLFVLSSFSPPAKGVSYVGNQGKITATFPSEYTNSARDGEAYTTTQATCTMDEQSYMISYTVHESDLSQTENLEDVSLNAFANAIGANIQSKETWKSKGLEGVKARMHSDESDAYIDYIVVFAGKVQYQFACYALGESWNEKKAKAFFKTIKVQ